MRGVCEQYDDCELPTETYDDPDGEEVCPNCGMVWEYEDGLFIPTERYEKHDDTQSTEV